MPGHGRNKKVWCDVSNALPQGAVHEGAARWLADLAKATEGEDKALFQALFREDAVWRDNAALTWTFNTEHDRAAVEQRWFEAAGRMEPTNLRFTDDWHLPGEVVSNGAPVFELIFAFETNVGHCTALVSGD